VCVYIKNKYRERMAKVSFFIFMRTCGGSERLEESIRMQQKSRE